MKKTVLIFASLMIFFACFSSYVSADANPLLGDSNLNGIVNIKDATVIQRYTAGIDDLSGNKFVVSDVNVDSIVNVKDATAIQRFAALIPIPYPIGLPIDSNVPEESTEVKVTDATVAATENVEPTTQNHGIVLPDIIW